MDNKETEARLLALYKLILSLENTLNNWVKENSALFEKTNNQPSEQTPKKQGNYEYWNHIWELIKKHNIDTKKLTKFIGCRMIELPPHAPLSKDTHRKLSYRDIHNRRPLKDFRQTL